MNNPRITRWTVVALGLLTAVQANAATVELTPSTRFQTMKGWEYTPRAWEIDKVANGYDASWEAHSTEVMRLMVEELGINRIRIEIKSGWENPIDYWSQFVGGTLTYLQHGPHYYEKINDNADPSVTNLAGFQFSEFDYYVEHALLPAKAALEARGEKLYVNLCYVDFNSSLPGTLKHALNPAEYAEMVHVYLDHLRDKYSIKPDAIELNLEPENTAEWRGQQIGHAIVALANRIRPAGYSPELIAPSTTSAAQTLPYLTEIAKVPGAVQNINMLSYHRYIGGNYAAIRTTAASYGMQTGMLEYIYGNYNHLIEDLTVAHASAWQMWGIASKANAGKYYYHADFSNPAQPKFKMQNDAALISPFFKFVRYGAVRIDAKSAVGNIVPVGFLNADGTDVLVLKVAAGTGGKPVDIAGLTPGTYSVYNVTFSAKPTFLADVTVGAGPTTLTIPEGITAIARKASAAPSVDGGIADGGGADVDADGSGPGAGTGAVAPASSSSESSSSSSSAAANAAARDASSAGCACEVRGGSKKNTPSSWVFVLGALAALRRRRTRRAA